MKASELKLDEFMKKTEVQFIIPVYQRNYDWSEKECKTLLRDITEIGESAEENKSHFIGNIVYVKDNITLTNSVDEFIIVDGQQRLTTIILIYLCLYRIAIEINDDALKGRIYYHYLTNEYAKNSEEKIKLKPAGNNDKALKAIFNKEENNYKEKSNVIDNFLFFKNNINKDNYNIIELGLKKLLFVEIILDKIYDDPQRIFESLNSTGLDLSQADLIRNYILMKLNSKEQEYIYNKYWQEIEELARDEENNITLVSDFIRDFITGEENKIPNKNKVYEKFKEKYKINDLKEIEDYLTNIKEYALYYNKLINPKNENDTDISSRLSYIKKLEVNVSYPFFMKVYKDYKNKVIDKTIFISILDFIESFVLRRFIIEVQTNPMNKIFMTLYNKIDKNNYLLSLQKYMLKLKLTQRFPNNKEIEIKLKDKDIYNINTKKRQYIFERLEKLSGKELVDFEKSNLTIEHIFPQNPCKEWEKSNDYELLKDNLHTIQNLTLSANNVELGNKTFKEKKYMNSQDKNGENGKQGYNYSKLWLNEYLQEIEEWNSENMQKRFNIIKDRFFKVWKYPNIKIDDNNSICDEINIFEADEPTNKKLEYIIFLDEKEEINDVSKLFAHVIKHLFSENKNIFFSNKEIKNLIKIAKNKEEFRSKYPINLNNIYYAENNFNNKDKFNIIKKLLTIFNMENELIIKYK